MLHQPVCYLFPPNINKVHGVSWQGHLSQAQPPPELKKEPPLQKMGLKVTLHLGKVSGLANPINTYKDDDIWPPLLFSLVNITQDIH
jgi:hypothetical protein